MPASPLLLLVFLIGFSWSNLELCTYTIDLFESLCSEYKYLDEYEEEGEDQEEDECGKEECEEEETEQLPKELLEYQEIR
uniref:Uncharacterized protein n=1 Tax=Solanum tuberosum TaxID=4113 RepID=M1CXG0_SOLTU